MYHMYEAEIKNEGFDWHIICTRSWFRYIVDNWHGYKISMMFPVRENFLEPII